MAIKKLLKNTFISILSLSLTLSVPHDLYAQNGRGHKEKKPPFNYQALVIKDAFKSNYDQIFSSLHLKIHQALYESKYQLELARNIQNPFFKWNLPTPLKYQTLRKELLELKLTLEKNILTGLQGPKAKAFLNFYLQGLFIPFKKLHDRYIHQENFRPSSNIRNLSELMPRFQHHGLPDIELALILNGMTPSQSRTPLLLNSILIDAETNLEIKNISGETLYISNNQSEFLFNFTDDKKGHKVEFLRNYSIMLSDIQNLAEVQTPYFYLLAMKWYLIYKLGRDTLTAQKITGQLPILEAPTSCQLEAGGIINNYHFEDAFFDQESEKRSKELTELLAIIGYDNELDSIQSDDYNNMIYQSIQSERVEYFAPNTFKTLDYYNELKRYNEQFNKPYQQNFSITLSNPADQLDILQMINSKFAYDFITYFKNRKKNIRRFRKDKEKRLQTIQTAAIKIIQQNFKPIVGLLKSNKDNYSLIDIKDVSATSNNDIAQVLPVTTSYILKKLEFQTTSLSGALKQAIPNDIKAKLKQNFIQHSFPNMYGEPERLNIAIQKLRNIFVDNSDLSNHKVHAFIQNACSRFMAYEPISEICLPAFGHKKGESIVEYSQRTSSVNRLVNLLKVISNQKTSIPKFRLYSQNFTQNYILLKHLWNTLITQTDLLDDIAITNEWDLILKQIEAGDLWASMRLTHLWMEHKYEVNNDSPIEVKHLYGKYVKQFQLDKDTSADNYTNLLKKSDIRDFTRAKLSMIQKQFGDLLTRPIDKTSPQNYFDILIDVNDQKFIDKKSTLKYLSQLPMEFDLVKINAIIRNTNSASIINIDQFIQNQLLIESDNHGVYQTLLKNEQELIDNIEDNDVSTQEFKTSLFKRDYKLKQEVFAQIFAQAAKQKVSEHKANLDNYCKMSPAMQTKVKIIALGMTGEGIDKLQEVYHLTTNLHTDFKMITGQGVPKNLNAYTSGMSVYDWRTLKLNMYSIPLLIASGVALGTSCSVSVVCALGAVSAIGAVSLTGASINQQYQKVQERTHWVNQNIMAVYSGYANQEKYEEIEMGHVGLVLELAFALPLLQTASKASVIAGKMIKNTTLASVKLAQANKKIISKGLLELIKNGKKSNLSKTFQILRMKNTQILKKYSSLFKHDIQNFDYKKAIKYLDMNNSKIGTNHPEQLIEGFANRITENWSPVELAKEIAEKKDKYQKVTNYLKQKLSIVNDNISDTLTQIDNLLATDTPLLNKLKLTRARNLLKWKADKDRLISELNALNHEDYKSWIIDNALTLVRIREYAPKSISYWAYEMTMKGSFTIKKKTPIIGNILSGIMLSRYTKALKVTLDSEYYYQITKLTGTNTHLESINLLNAINKSLYQIAGASSEFQASINDFQSEIINNIRLMMYKHRSTFMRIGNWNQIQKYLINDDLLTALIFHPGMHQASDRELMLALTPANKLLKNVSSPDYTHEFFAKAIDQHKRVLSLNKDVNKQISIDDITALFELYRIRATSQRVFRRNVLETL